MKAREILELCDARVSSKSHTEEQCTEELFDFLHARDHCVSLPESDFEYLTLVCGFYIAEYKLFFFFSGEPYLENFLFI